MAIIVRRKIKNSFGEEDDEITFRSLSHPINQEEIKNAETIDVFFANKMMEIKQDLISRGLTDSEKGDINRWYALGEHLAKFIDDPSIIPRGDRMNDRYIWEALWFHAPLCIRPGPPNTNTGTARDHFRLCYELQKIPFDIARNFTWSDWVNFLETPAVIQDGRITDWVWRKLPGAKRGALRSLTRLLRRQFRRRDLNVLTDTELFDEMEKAWSEVPEELIYK